MKPTISLALIAFAISIIGCGTRSRSEENTPTSGHLRVYYDEGLKLHVSNQVYTFNALYRDVHVEEVMSTEQQAVQALYADSCEAIVISRLLSENEKAAFSSKGFHPRYSRVAVTGVAIIVNAASPFRSASRADIRTLLHEGKLADSAAALRSCTLIFDREGSAVLNYMMDSVARKRSCDGCSAAGSTTACIERVASDPAAVGIIDFAWLSDQDDALFRQYRDRVKMLAVGETRDSCYYPDQSSFKTGRYPFARSVYVMRKTGEFTTAKGFESFVAGPKGQLTFLKQGLLPARQAERNIEASTE
jgi:phosphate transport system substrate-binding protein